MLDVNAKNMPMPIGCSVLGGGALFSFFRRKGVWRKSINLQRLLVQYFYDISYLILKSSNYQVLMASYVTSKKQIEAVNGSVLHDEIVVGS